MKQFLLKPYKYGLHIYYKIRTSIPVWKILNSEGASLLKENPPTFTSEQKRVLTDLQKTGIGTTTLDALFPGKNMLALLNDFARTLNPENAEQGKKKFLKKYWDRHPQFDLSNPFLAFTLNPTVLDIANSYMGMFTKLKYYDLALTLPVPAGSEAVQSQRWHRDPEDKKICKVFIYLNDVDETAGPFIYALESNQDGRFGNLLPQYTPEGIYPKEGEVEKGIPQENIKKMTAKAGTVIFCDTSGLHKGGYATAKERLMFTGFFTANTYSEKPYYQFPEGFSIEKSGLSPQAVYAIKA